MACFCTFTVPFMFWIWIWIRIRIFPYRSGSDFYYTNPNPHHWFCYPGVDDEPTYSSYRYTFQWPEGARGDVRLIKIPWVNLFRTSQSQSVTFPRIFKTKTGTGRYNMILYSTVLNNQQYLSRVLLYSVYTVYRSIGTWGMDAL